MKIPFNIPFVTGVEFGYVEECIKQAKLSGNGSYTKLIRKFFADKYGIKDNLLTTSCTDALEMAALLLEIEPGDEVIVPSFTFVSTANAFVLFGAKPIFVDSRPDHPGMNEDLIEEAITERTKAIVPVHYAGVACDMDKIEQIARPRGIHIVEDAAQAIDAKYKNRYLGSIGDFGTFSFHETKNIQCGEGGLLAINKEELMARAEIIWEKGTNRAAFWRGEVNKYGWVDKGASFLASEINAAFLYAQLEEIDAIQALRRERWGWYYEGLKPLAEEEKLKLPVIPEYATNNAHMFYIICNSLDERTSLIKDLKSQGIDAVFHYLALDDSEYAISKWGKSVSPESRRYTDCLLRLPLYPGLAASQVEFICEAIRKHYS